MIRSLLSFGAAGLFSILSLLSLMSLIDTNNVSLSESENLRFIDFVRVEKEKTITKKERIKPKKKEVKKKPLKPKVDIPRPKKPKTSTRTINKPNISPPINLSASSVLGDAMVASGERAISTNVVPLVRVNPVYPRRARSMKKEGFVKLEFTITPSGSVKDVVVVESNPKKIFDRSATRALLKWKFRAKVEDNKAVEQRALVQINFKLDR